VNNKQAIIFERVYEKFVARAVREGERQIGVPPGWCGRYTDVRGPNGARVFFSSGGWTVTLRGVRVSRHDSRPNAIKKASRL
jgi:hypothetical protein